MVDMQKVIAEPRKNRLYIALSAMMSQTDTERLVAAVLRESAKLKPGFDVISDISNFRNGDSSGVPLLGKAMSFLQSLGVGRVIRVVGGSKEGLLQFALATKEVNGYPVRYVVSLAEAEEMLEYNAEAEMQTA